jgi:hypothetical protein
MIGILKMHQNMEPADDQPRKLFRNANGFDFQRLVEQALPSVVIGAIVVYANFRVLEAQVASIREEMARQASEVRVSTAAQSNTSERLTAVSERVASFLGQQVQFNSSVDSRITYLERSNSSRFNR